ncbi:hypothetical protein ACLB2K_031880 [Fragaria x ananassa]
MYNSRRAELDSSYHFLHTENSGLITHTGIIPRTRAETHDMEKFATCVHWKQDPFKTRPEYKLGGTGTGSPFINNWSMGILYIKSPLKTYLERELRGTYCSPATTGPASDILPVDRHQGYPAMVKDHQYHNGNVLLRAAQFVLAMILSVQSRGMVAVNASSDTDVPSRG